MNNAIPKVIHYCWFGGKPLPKSAQRCIASWRKFLPDYEIKEWNESNFDFNAIPYTREAYEEKKYAFVSDYARFKILYEHGGLYFDTDVEIIRPLDDIIERGPFMGCEQDATGATAIAVAPGLGLGVNPGLELYKEILDLYATLYFKNADGTLNLKTVVLYTTEILAKHGLSNKTDIQNIAGIWIYPKEYFNPIEMTGRRLSLTANTHSIHHYAATWQSPYRRMKKKIARLMGNKITMMIILIKNAFRKHGKSI